MTSIRGQNSTIQASTIHSSPIAKVLKILNSVNTTTNYTTMTSDELNITLGDPNIILGDPNIEYITSLAPYIIPFMLILLIIIGIINYIEIGSIKHKLKIPNVIDWVMNKYKNYSLNVKQVLPLYGKKAKESPFIGSQPTPLLLPNCARLDRIEKRQNLNVQFSIPYRRFQSTENLENEEHRITITTVVQSPKMTSL